MARHAGCRCHPVRFRQRYPYVFAAIVALIGVEPLAWLTDVLERMFSGRTKAHELKRLLP